MIITPIEQEILNYLKDNPGVSKADVVRYMRDRQMASKMTVFDYLEELENKNMIYGRKQRPNSQSFMMYVNEDNRVLTALLELDNFRKAYSLLLQKSIEILDNKDYSEDARALGFNEPHPSKWSNKDKIKFLDSELDKVYEFNKTLSESSGGRETPIATRQESLKKFGKSTAFLLIGPVRIFYMMVDIIFFLSVLRWPNQIKDDKILSQIYSIAYGKIAEIQRELSRFIESTKLYEPDKLIVEGRSVSSEGFSFGIIVIIYGKSGLEPEIMKLVNSIDTLNEDIKELNLLPSSFFTKV